MKDLNPDDEQINIPYSHYKLAGLLVISLGFVGMGLWFFLYPSMIANSGLHHKPVLEVAIMGIVTIIAFGSATLYLIYRFFSSKPGLIIDDTGISNISSFISVGTIKWEDITKISIDAIGPAVYIGIYVKNPDDYINRLKNSFVRKTIRSSYNRNGAIFSISTDGLKCDFNDLYSLLNTRLTEFKEAKKFTKFEGTL